MGGCVGESVTGAWDRSCFRSTIPSDATVRPESSLMQVGKLGSIARTVLILLATTFVSACARLPALPGSPMLDPQSTSSIAEPGHVAEYVTAFARGDEGAADRVASPLYRLEWARRGVTPGDRQALRY